MVSVILFEQFPVPLTLWPTFSAAALQSSSTLWVRARTRPQIWRTLLRNATDACLELYARRHFAHLPPGRALSRWSARFVCAPLATTVTQHTPAGTATYRQPAPKRPKAASCSGASLPDLHGPSCMAARGDNQVTCSLALAASCCAARGGNQVPGCLRLLG
jgi:hypothetical protein